MSWAYVPASAGWSSDCTSPSLEQIQSFLSSRTNFASPFCSDAGQAHSSGTTCSPSTGDPGAAASMFSQPASHASPGALPVSASASRMSGGSSRRSASSFAKWTPNGSSWRTFQLSLLEEGLPLFSGPWPTSGLMRSGECFPASNWEPVISESESLSWATPVAGNCKGEASNNRDLCRDAKRWPTPKACNSDKGGRPRPNDRGDLCASAKMWDTPTACEDEGIGFRTRGTPKLKGQTKQWPTPTAQTYGSNQSPSPGASVRPSLDGMAKTWPTATASEGGGHYGNGAMKLDGAARSWPTATARDYRSGKSNINHNSRPLSEVVCRSGPQDPELTGETSRGNSGRLNSRFVQWLMGFPPGWSFPEELVSKHWETLCRRQLERLLGESSRVA